MVLVLTLLGRWKEIFLRTIPETQLSLQTMLVTMLEILLEWDQIFLVLMLNHRVLHLLWHQSLLLESTMNLLPWCTLFLSALWEL